MIKIIKRSGDKVDFDINRIIHAIMAAQSNIHISNYDAALQMSLKIQESLSERPDVSIDEMHMLVEMELMEKMPEVARCYIGHRSVRDFLRKTVSGAIE